MDNDFKFEQDEIVSFNIGNMVGVGKIKGVATYFPLTGHQYIIEVMPNVSMIPNKEYPFTHFVCWESGIFKADREEEK